MSQVQANGHSESGHFSGSSFAESISFHASQPHHPGYEHGFYERSGYIEGPGIENHPPGYSHIPHGLPEMYPTPQATSTRTSVLNSPSNYESPASPVVYPHWPTSNPPSHPSTYSFQPQPPSVQAFGGQMTRGPSYATSAVDGILPPTADVHHGDIFAPGSVGPAAIPHQPAYPNFVMERTSSVGPTVKGEGGHNPSIPQ